MNLVPKDYLGDAVYAEHDGYSVVLTTENGVETTNTIVLEPEVVRALVNYAARCGIRIPETKT